MEEHWHGRVTEIVITLQQHGYQCPKCKKATVGMTVSVIVDGGDPKKKRISFRCSSERCAWELGFPPIGL